jgi:hypothetical protein
MSLRKDLLLSMIERLSFLKEVDGEDLIDSVGRILESRADTHGDQGWEYEIDQYVGVLERYYRRKGVLVEERGENRIFFAGGGSPDDFYVLTGNDLRIFDAG